MYNVHVRNHLQYHTTIFTYTACIICLFSCLINAPSRSSRPIAFAAPHRVCRATSRSPPRAPQCADLDWNWDESRAGWSSSQPPELIDRKIPNKSIPTSQPCVCRGWFKAFFCSHVKGRHMFLSMYIYECNMCRLRRICLYAWGTFFDWWSCWRYIFDVM